MLAQTTGLTKLIMSSHLPDALGGGMYFMEDPRAMQKSASTIFGCEYDDVKPDKDHVGIHVVGLGAWEWYGANRNADSFPKEACEKFHDTFVKHGHVFRNHVNKDPAGALGNIVKSAFNPAMGRIELFLHAHKEKARDELQKLARDGEHGFSMACRVPHDRCSRCNTLRKSASDLNQCDHIRYELRKVARDGTVTCTHNDLPTFFDMSFVGRPADRIAWDLKVASWDAADSCKLAADEGIWVPESVLATELPVAQKLLLFDKLAAAERYLYELAVKAPATVSERYTWELCKAADYDLSDTAIETMRREDPAIILTKLAQAGVVLSPSAFFKYAFGTSNNPLAAEMPAILAFIKAGVFSQLSKEARQAACINSYFDIDSNTQGAYILSRDPDLETLASSLKKDASFADPAVRQRVIEQTVAGRAVKIPTVMSGQTKVALSHSDTVEKSAHIYAAYKLSAVSAINALSLVDQNSLTTLAAAQNLLTQPE